MQAVLAGGEEGEVDFSELHIDPKYPNIDGITRVISTLLIENELYIQFNEKWKQGRTKLIILWISVFIYSFLLNFNVWESYDKLTNQEINIFLQLLRALLTSIIGLELIFLFYMFLIFIFIGKEEVKLKRLKRVKNEK